MIRKIIACLFLCVIFCSTSFSGHTNPIDILQTMFRQYHSNAVNERLAYIKQHYPVITQDLLSMSLHLPGLNEGIKFKMNPDKVMAMATISHPPLSLFDLISTDGFNVALSDDTRFKLSQYQETLNKAQEVYLTNNKLNALEKQYMTHIFNHTNVYIEATLKENTAEITAYKNYINTIKPAIRGALYVAAYDQLTQFKNKIFQWRNEYPELDWSELRVAILGFHQPRNDYLPSQFFQKLLHEPDYEKHVVYVEFQGSIYPTKETKAIDSAFLLLANIDYDQSVANQILNDPKALEYDVMGPAAKNILKNWELNWF